MSAVPASPASPAPPGPGAVHTRRPSTLTVYRWELRKLLSQKRTYLGLGLAVLLPLIFVLVEILRHRPDRHADSIFAKELTQSGLATPILMLLFLSAFFLPLIAALVSGDIVAAEDGNGTLKTILTRSAERGQVFAAKVFAAMAYAAIAVFLARPYRRRPASPRGAFIGSSPSRTPSSPRRKPCCSCSPPTPPI